MARSGRSRPGKAGGAPSRSGSPCGHPHHETAGSARAQPSASSAASPLQSLQPVLPIARHHRERWDGSGYPDGLDGEVIPLIARNFQVVDIFEALSTARPHKSALARTEGCPQLGRSSVPPTILS
ncbi:MAG TPA: HD domain-containing phosphohydrolase [Candidatus Methylomirabilis sp.]|nr:HD domain-containing phosphohydrolase [Candidatus Methylomirabilis sp.]